MPVGRCARKGVLSTCPCRTCTPQRGHCGPQAAFKTTRFEEPLSSAGHWSADRYGLVPWGVQDNDLLSGSPKMLSTGWIPLACKGIHVTCRRWSHCRQWAGYGCVTSRMPSPCHGAISVTPGGRPVRRRPSSAGVPRGSLNGHDAVDSKCPLRPLTVLLTNPVMTRLRTKPGSGRWWLIFREYVTSVRPPSRGRRR